MVFRKCAIVAFRILVVCPTVRISSFAQDVPRSEHVIHGKRAAEECNDIRTCRTIFDIVWSSIAVTFACVWISMHPNVPEQPNEPGWKFTVRRIELMILGLIAPELVVARAFSERRDARRIAGDFNISVTHAYFLQMGGFADRSRCLPIIEDDLRDNNILEKIKMIEERDIKDRAKSDALSKGITVLETLWFLTQCVVRARNGLATSEIELSAFAFAVINVFTYSFWWDKPQGVERSIVLDCDVRPNSQSQSRTEEADSSGRQSNVDGVNSEGAGDKRGPIRKNNWIQRTIGRLLGFLEWVLKTLLARLDVQEPPGTSIWIQLQHIPILGMALEGVEAAFVRPHTRPFNKRL